jgi:hypothetical protein
MGMTSLLCRQRFRVEHFDQCVYQGFHLLWWVTKYCFHAVWIFTVAKWSRKENIGTSVPGYSVLLQKAVIVIFVTTGTLNLSFIIKCITVYYYGELFVICIPWKCHLKGIICENHLVVILEYAALLASHRGLCYLSTFATEFILLAIAYWKGSDVGSVKLLNKLIHH